MCPLNYITKHSIYSSFEHSCNSGSTTSLGYLFQSLITVSVNTFFLISNPNLPWHNLWPFPPVLFLVDQKVRSTRHNLLSGSCSSYSEVGGKKKSKLKHWLSSQAPHTLPQLPNLLKAPQGRFSHDVIPYNRWN